MLTTSSSWLKFVSLFTNSKVRWCRRKIPVWQPCCADFRALCLTEASFLCSSLLLGNKVDIPRGAMLGLKLSAAAHKLVLLWKRNLTYAWLVWKWICSDSRQGALWFSHGAEKDFSLSPQEIFGKLRNTLGKKWRSSHVIQRLTTLLKICGWCTRK